MFNTMKNFILRNIVTFIAFVLAMITIIFVPIDNQYLHYIDYKTISCLFMISCIISAFKDINFFYSIARQIIIRFNTLRKSYIALITMLMKYEETHNPMLYHKFRQGLDILDLDPITYEMIGCNKNSMGYWLPAMADLVSNEDFLKTMYKAFFDREPDEGGYNGGYGQGAGSAGTAYAGSPYAGSDMGPGGNYDMDGETEDIPF